MKIISKEERIRRLRKSVTELKAMEGYEQVASEQEQQLSELLAEVEEKCVKIEQKGTGCTISGCFKPEDLKDFLSKDWFVVEKLQETDYKIGKLR